MKTRLVLLIILCCLLTGCKKKPAIEGLWIVEKVRAGDQEMTPNARWTRFNFDFRQESGNGWLRHSYGSWKFDPDSALLWIRNENGLKDPFGPFQIIMKENTMSWERMEEGSLVQVYLKRTDKLPETYGDRILGKWQLESASGEGNYFSPREQASGDSYVFFRWDRRFEIRSSLGRFFGVYNVHGHKPELELIPYGDLERNFWKIEYSEDTIHLNLLNSGRPVRRSFTRTSE